MSTQTVQRVKELLKNIDVYELMLAEIEDYAMWLLNDIMNECREYANAKSRGNEKYFNIYINECLYEGKDYFKKNFVNHVNEVYDSAKTLFGAFIAFDPEKINNYSLR